MAKLTIEDLRRIFSEPRIDHPGRKGSIGGTGKPGTPPKSKKNKKNAQ